MTRSRSATRISSAALRWGLGLSVVLAVVAAGLMMMPAAGGRPWFPMADKVQHFLAFMAIVLPAAVVLPGRGVMLVLLAVAFGGAIELIQPLTGRGAEWGDLAADALGALAALPAARWLRARLGARLDLDQP